MGNVSPLQPQPQVAVVAVDLVPSDPAEGHSRFQRPLQHPPGQLRLGAECRFLRHPSLSPPFQVISPHPRQVEFPVQQGPPLGRGVGQKYPDLAVLDPPRRAAILPLHPNGLVPLLQKSRLVHHQNSMDVAQMLYHVVPEIVADQVGVPDAGGQQVLHPIGGGVPRLLRQLPAVLAFHGTEQPPQVVQRPPTRLGTPESSRNALVYPFDSLGPTGHLRHIFYHTYHRLTSPALDCLDSTRLCSATVVLGMGGNLLIGGIPPELGSLTNLIFLDLSYSQLSGPIPSELGGLTNLQFLYLSDNKLTGPIPVELGNLTKLASLDMKGNQLSGPIPAELGNLTNLEILDLTSNELSGSIPGELGGLAKLRHFYLSENQLSGPIPGELGGLTDLRYFYLSDNRLSGPIPAQLGNLTSLLTWYNQNNKLNGPIPAELGNLTNLQVLYLADNKLTGPLPPELGDLTNLDTLFVDNNQLGGPLPPELGGLTNLRILELY